MHLLQDIKKDFTSVTDRLETNLKANISDLKQDIKHDLAEGLLQTSAQLENSFAAQIQSERSNAA